MAVKVIIKRRVPDEIFDFLAPLLKELRNLAMNQEGYISGVTLKRIDDPGESLKRIKSALDSCTTKPRADLIR